MSVWFDGLSALSDHIWTVLIILVLCFWGVFVIRFFLQRELEKSLTEIELFTLSAVGWIFPLLLLSILTFFVSLFTNLVVGGVFFVLVFFSSTFLIVREKINVLLALKFILFLIVFIVLRFAFLKNLFLPSYFDSAEHYRLISLINDAYRFGVISSELIDSFYHLGFHFISAFFSVFLQVHVIDFMLVFGQVVLAFLTPALFFVIKRETGSSSSAVLTCVLSTFGFHMPAYLMNWGKYPALSGLIAMLFVFGLAYMIYRKDMFQVRKTFFVFLAGVFLLSVFIHSRTFIVFSAMLIAILVTSLWSHLNSLHRFIGFCVLILVTGALLNSVKNSVVLRPLLESYLRDDVWILLLVLALTFASLFHYAKQSFFLILWLTIMVLCMFIPVLLPRIGVQTLLDRPFVQMFAVVPLSILGGLGSSSLMELFARLNINQKIFRYLTPIFLVGAVIINVAQSYKFYSSSCCRFVTLDDLAAFSWMEQSLPDDQKILVASSNLYVNPLDSGQTPVGVDAGIWILPLLSYETIFAERGISFDVKTTYTELCASNIDYIYVGGMPDSFNSAQLDNHPNWYSSSFILPSARIYQVIGCER